MHTPLIAWTVNVISHWETLYICSVNLSIFDIKQRLSLQQKSEANLKKSHHGDCLKIKSINDVTTRK